MNPKKMHFDTQTEISQMNFKDFFWQNCDFFILYVQASKKKKNSEKKKSNFSVFSLNMNIQNR